MTSDADGNSCLILATAQECDTTAQVLPTSPSQLPICQVSKFPNSK